MAEEEKEEKKSNKLLPIIIGAVGGIVLLLAGLALGFFLFSSPAADPSAEVDEIIEKNSEGEEEIEEDDNSTPDKIALDTPENQVFLTTYYEFYVPFFRNFRGLVQPHNIPYGGFSFVVVSQNVISQKYIMNFMY